MDLPLIKTPEKLEAILKAIPSTSGVYFMQDRQKNILYIGKSKKLRSRLRSYFRDSSELSHRIALMVQEVYEIEFIVTDNESEALALEANLIKHHQPYFNILLKDDKKYPFVCITWSELYPRIFITRKRLVKNTKDRYYGPYVDSRSIRDILQIIKQIFPLRQRPKPLFKDRPCLNYDIGKCPGVCQGLISPESYCQTMEKVAMIFQGRMGELVTKLTEQMLHYSQNLEFEKAGKIRDQIQVLQTLHQDQKVALPDDTLSQDAVALAHDRSHACIQLFQIRAGQMVGRLVFFVHIQESKKLTSFSINLIESQEDLGLILQRVLEEHYSHVDPVEIPKEILLQYPLPDQDLISSWLSDKKGKKVTLITPQRQMKAELLLMVEKNAHYELLKTQQEANNNALALQDLADILDLPTIPHRMEGYDISHIQGSNAVASQVVFIEGIPATQYYRHYKIKNPTVKIGHSDDFASMAEVIARRFRDYDANDENNPDLIMIDGGKGQLSAVVEVLENLGIMGEFAVVSLAKKREEIFLPYGTSPLKTDPEQKGVQLLRRLRDAAHHFAVNFHRQQRQKSSIRSTLDAIPGLGVERQKLLFEHFTSLEHIRQANLQKLTEVQGIGPRLAETIYNYFHEDN